MCYLPINWINNKNSVDRQIICLNVYELAVGLTVRKKVQTFSDPYSMWPTILDLKDFLNTCLITVMLLKAMWYILSQLRQ